MSSSLQRHSTSASQLLAPSPNSTDRPSRSNLKDYGSSEDSVSRNDSVASFELLLPTEASDRRRRDHRSRDGMIGQLLQRFRKRPVVSVGALITISGLVALLVSLVLPSGLSFWNPAERKRPRLQGADRPPFSTLDPVKDLGLSVISRPQDSHPPKSLLRDSKDGALPTNRWYQNLLMSHGEPTSVHRCYPMPYVVDAVGPIPGLRAHPNHFVASTTVVQLSFVDSHGLTLGASPINSTSQSELPTSRYSVVSTTALGLTMEWDALPMTSSIVKGMPYTTMHYPKPLSNYNMLPTIASETKLSSAPLIDGGDIMLDCREGNASRVDSDLQLSFKGSDFTWLVFFSEPVMVKCVEQDSATGVMFQVVDTVTTDEEQNPDQLTVRAALLDKCTTGENQMFCAHRESASRTNKYRKLLRESAHLYPGPKADVRYEIGSDNDKAVLTFDWDVRDMKKAWNDQSDAAQSHLRRYNSIDSADEEGGKKKATQPELIAYALPHHLHRIPQSQFPWGDDSFCTHSIIGSICLVSGSCWNLTEDLPPIAFQAPRPPKLETLSALSMSLPTDLSFEMSKYYQQGAGDTYFSGKMLARMARVLLIAEELRNLCSTDNHDGLKYSLTSKERKAYAEACGQIQLPSNEEMRAALSRLRDAVEVWINGEAITPFVYDTSWGGVISCGCNFDGKTSTCSNRFPDCPSVQDPGINFGNGFYNDHHFHYGYHIYAAAAVTHFDKAWGRKHFENVLFLVRDIANPSSDDVYFPQFRQKDWYQGNSWASGVSLPPYPNGKNQESSSEAIASYEAVALFGKEMTNAWKDVSNDKMVDVSSHIYDVGRLMAATEIRAADYYWHVRRHDESMKIYPSIYAQNVIGIVWNAMVQFQTWFGSASYLAIGIQLLPLTSISEERDNQAWVRELYPEFAESCGSVDDCIVNGWSILQLATLATVGHIDLAIERAQQLPASAFESAGGNGHSLSNTIWYFATRPDVEPIDLSNEKSVPSAPEENETALVVDCGIPEQCTKDVLDADAKGSTCRERIEWLMTAMGYSEQHACSRVAGGEFSKTCGPCDPGVAVDENEETNTSQCPSCTREECRSDLNRCPRYETTFVCTKGLNIGGCSKTPWILDDGLCSRCCDVTVCIDYEDLESNETNGAAAVVSGAAASENKTGGNCEKCDPEVCTSKLNLCPIDAAPYLCVKGKNIRGCSPWPWRTDDGECEKCCDLEKTCG